MASAELSCSIIGAGEVVPERPTSAAERPESPEAKVGRPRICSRKSSAGVSEALFAMSRSLSLNWDELRLNQAKELETQNSHEAESEIGEYEEGLVWFLFLGFALT